MKIEKTIEFDTTWSEQQIIDHASEIDWFYYFNTYGKTKYGRIISWDTISLISSYFNWDTWSYISGIDDIPEWFIRLYHKELSWDTLSVYQLNLSIDFMREFADKINWDMRYIVHQKFWKQNEKFKKEMGYEKI